MKYSEALKFIEQGMAMTRSSWYCKQMFVYLVKSTRVPLDQLRNEASKHLRSNDESDVGKSVIINSHIDKLSKDGTIIVGWSPTTEDMLADDWETIS